jgi:hypothetical protein
MSEAALQKETVSWRTAAVAAVVVALGVVILSVTSVESWWEHHHTFQHAIEKVGDLVFATGLLAVLWELKGKRDFFAEILATLRISGEMRAAGIAQITPNFRERIDWQALFRSVREVDVLVAYARTWRNNDLDSLREFARRDARLRIILPDSDDAITVATLAQRYATDAQEVRARIAESIREFQELATGGRAIIEVWSAKAPPVYTMYRFDSRAVVAFYNHQVDRSPVPAMLVEEGGVLYEFVRKDFENLLQDRRRCRLVYPVFPQA